MTDNPKLAGSPIINCRVQTGKCPNDCEECFFNNEFYEDIDKPHIPTVEECRGKIVRMNDGHDSNFEKGRVLDQADIYDAAGIPVYMNTSIPNFVFPRPNGGHYACIFCANGREPLFIEDLPANVAAVRIRWTRWNEHELIRLARHYHRMGVPVLVTWMRFREPHPEMLTAYKRRKTDGPRVWVATPATKCRTMEVLCQDMPGILQCGTCYSDKCVDCGNCPALVHACNRRMRSA